MKKPQLFFEKADINDYVRSLWRTEAFKRSHDTGGLVSRIVDRFSNLPRFFYEMSDEYLERAHFSIWWSGVAHRDYAEDSCSDLYLLHEFAHGADMVHMAGQPFESFRRKMQDDELYASVTTEVMTYFDMPELREMGFPDGIFADRFLGDETLQARYRAEPERLTAELYYRRRNAMFNPDESDPVERWLAAFTVQNDKWFDIWQYRYDEVETAMERLVRLSAQGARREALLRHMEWLETVSADGIPFLPEAEFFAKVYWKNRELPQKAAA